MATSIYHLAQSLPISKHNPFLSIQSSLDKAMEDFYTGIKPFSKLTDWENFNLLPAMDIVESDDNLKIELEMPGMGPEDIKINISNNTINISGEKSTSKQDKDKNYVMREIGYGYYERSIPLASYLDANKAEASFKKGMLWITVPKKKGQESGKTEIKIKAV